jgi:hypothetical protein
MGRGSAFRKAATYANTEEKGRHTPMPRMEFDPTISEFERERTVLAPDR